MASDFFDTCPVYQGGGNQRYKKIGCCSDTLMGALVGRLMIMLPCAWEFWQLTWEWKLEFLQERLENWGLRLTSRRSSLSFAQNPRKPRGGEELLMLGNVTLHLPLAGLWVGGIGWAWFWPVKKKKKIGSAEMGSSWEFSYVRELGCEDPLESKRTQNRKRWSKDQPFSVSSYLSADTKAWPTA